MFYDQIQISNVQCGLENVYKVAKKHGSILSKWISTKNKVPYALITFKREGDAERFIDSMAYNKYYWRVEWYDRERRNKWRVRSTIEKTAKLLAQSRSRNMEKVHSVLPSPRQPSNTKLTLDTVDMIGINEVVDNNKVAESICMIPSSIHMRNIEAVHRMNDDIQNTVDAHPVMEDNDEKMENKKMIEPHTNVNEESV